MHNRRDINVGKIEPLPNRTTTSSMRQKPHKLVHERPNGQTERNQLMGHRPSLEIEAIRHEIETTRSNKLIRSAISLELISQ